MHAAGFMSAAYTALKLHNEDDDDDDGGDVRCGFFSEEVTLLLLPSLPSCCYFPLLIQLELQSENRNQFAFFFAQEAARLGSSRLLLYFVFDNYRKGVY